jgi:hypothetical protein
MEIANGFGGERKLWQIEFLLTQNQLNVKQQL